MEKLIYTAKLNHWKVCIYGLGKIGSKYGPRFVETLGLTIDYYCDKNNCRYEELAINQSLRLSLDELLIVEEDILVIATIGYKYESEVVRILSANKNIHIITWSEICNYDLIIKAVLGLNDFPKRKEQFDSLESIVGNARSNHNGRISIYTCITGGYDTPPSILCRESNCDYYLITDNEKYDNAKDYIVLNVNDIVPKNIISPKEQNRYCKMHGSEIFSEYEYSIYLDGNLQIYGNISECIKYIGNYGLAIHRHPFSKDPYAEAVRLVAAGRITEEEARIIARWLYDRGIPRNIFYLDCNVIVSEHCNTCGKAILEQWWKLYSLGLVKRDQFYMASVLYEYNINAEKIGIIPGNVEDDNYVKCLKYH